MDIKSEFKSIIKRDKHLSHAVRLKNLPDKYRDVSKVLAHSADPKFIWPALMLVWLFGNIFWKQWAITIVLGIALLGLATFPIKHLVDRRRPFGFWQRKTRDKDPHSFPSGHASRSFLLAVLTTGLGPAWLAVVLWIWAPLVSLGRVAMGVHYISDVVGGLLLATIVGILWLHFHEAALQVLVSFFLSVIHLPLW